MQRGLLILAGFLETFLEILTGKLLYRTWSGAFQQKCPYFLSLLDQCPTDARLPSPLSLAYLGVFFLYVFLINLFLIMTITYLDVFKAHLLLLKTGGSPVESYPRVGFLGCKRYF